MQDTWLSSVMLLVHQTLIERGLDADAIALASGLVSGPCSPTRMPGSI